MRRRITALAAALAILAAGSGLLHAQPEFITITSARAFGTLSRPPVQFPHQLHVSLDGMRCASCHHHSGAGKSSIRCAGCHVGRLEIRNAFHRSCVGCHDAAQSRGVPTGPRTCGQCHPLGGASRPLGGASRPLGGASRPLGGPGRP